MNYTSSTEHRDSSGIRGDQYEKRVRSRVSESHKMMRMTVTNAGVDLVNGTYYQLPGSINEEFIKPWSSERVHRSQDKHVWFISKPRVADTDFDFYMCRCDNGRLESGVWEPCKGLSLESSRTSPLVKIKECTSFEKIAVKVTLKLHSLCIRACVHKLDHLDHCVVSREVDLSRMTNADLCLLVFEAWLIEYFHHIVFVLIFLHAFLDHDPLSSFLLIAFLSCANFQFPRVKTGFWFFATVWVTLEIIVRYVLDMKHFDLWESYCVAEVQVYFSRCSLLLESGNPAVLVVLLFCLMCMFDIQARTGEYRGWKSFQSASKTTKKSSSLRTGPSTTEEKGTTAFVWSYQPEMATDSDWVDYSDDNCTLLESAIVRDEQYLLDPFNSSWYVDIPQMKRIHLDSKRWQPVRRVTSASQNDQQSQQAKRSDGFKRCSYCVKHRLHVRSCTQEFDQLSSFRASTAELNHVFMCLSCGCPMSEVNSYGNVAADVHRRRKKATGGNALQRARIQGDLIVIHTDFSPYILEQVFKSHESIDDILVWARWMNDRIVVVAIVKPSDKFLLRHYEQTDDSLLPNVKLNNAETEMMDLLQDIVKTTRLHVHIVGVVCHKAGDTRDQECRPKQQR